MEMATATTSGTSGRMSEGTALKLTDEQLQELVPFINSGRNIVAEIRLASAPGEQSAAHLFVKTIDHKTAAKVRKALHDDKPTNL